MGWCAYLRSEHVQAYYAVVVLGGYGFGLANTCLIGACGPEYADQQSHGAICALTPDDVSVPPDQRQIRTGTELQRDNPSGRRRRVALAQYRDARVKP